MPPKPAPGKGGKADEVDLSDLASLPQLNSVTFSILFGRFFSAHTRERLQKYVHEHLSQERVKILARDEIITYGKGKQLILEPGQAGTLPADDPRAKMTEAEQVAKAAFEKIFEMQVLARRTKKERLQKLEDEAKTSVQPLQIDHDLLDAIFQLVDFPQSKDEAVAFAKLGSTLNLVFEIQQNLRLPRDDDDEDVFARIQSQEQELDPSQEGNDHANWERSNHRIEQLLAARLGTPKNSPLRQLAHIKLDYVNFPYHQFKVNEHGEEHEIKKEADEYFSDLLNEKIEHYGALFIKYLRFKERVQLMPLAPDHQVLHTLMNLQGQSEEYKQWLSNVENVIASLDQKMQTDPSISENVAAQKKEVEEEKVSKAADEEERKRIIHECRDKLKESVDDKYYISNYGIETYREQMATASGNREVQNSIGSIMNAMVSQIAHEHSYNDVYEQHIAKEQQEQHEKSTTAHEEESIDDLFESFNNEVSFDLQLKQRPAYTKNQDQEVADPLTSIEPNERNRREGAKPYLADHLEATGEFVEYNQESDREKSTLQRLLKVTPASDEKRAEEVVDRGKRILENLVLPGIYQRNLMPPVSLKSERVRDAERANVYPFATLPVEEVERGLIFKAFQELVRSNHIDEGVQSDKLRHPKYKVFERSYQENFMAETLRQVLAEALLQEPDMATLYYPRDDSLLVALYNKVKMERIQKVDGERNWRAAYRVMPDFENWVRYFSEDMVVEAHGVTKAEGQPMKYQLDEEMVPETLIDIDDQKVSNIQERSQMLYPFDGSVMKVDAISVGGQDFKKSIVLKDNIAFGLRRATDRPYEGNTAPVEEHGLVAYKKVGKTDMWLRFENDTKVLIEAVQKKRNPQKLIRIDPPKPTPEEIAAREEAIKQAQAAAAKNKGKPGAPVAPVIEEYKEPEPTWEPEPFDFLDSLFNDDELAHTHLNQATTTLGNGLIVQHMSDGNIIQMTQDQLLKGESEERDRLFLYSSQGVVVRHLRNRDAEVLFPSGVRAVFTKKNMTWVVTNNKGLRRAKKAGIEWELDPVPCAYETDAVTNARMMLRDDKVVTIEFSDGSLFCQHADGTLMKTSTDGCEVRIEKQGYAPVLFKRGIDMDGTMVFPGRMEIEQPPGNRLLPEDRCYDHMLVETHLPDGTIVDTYLDCGNSDEEVGIQHIFNRPDYSVLTVNQLDRVKVISANARFALNEGSGKRVLGQDYDYLSAIHSDPEDSAPGVYTAVVSPTHTEIHTNDKEVSYLLTADLSLVKQSLVATHGEVEKVKTAAAQQADKKEGDLLENIGGSKNPRDKYYTMPRLFVIRNDGSGYELLTKEQLAHYMRLHKGSPLTFKQKKDIMMGNTQAQIHYYLYKVRTLQEREKENTHLKYLEFPQNSLYTLLHLKPDQLAPAFYSTAPDLTLQPDQYVFRQIYEYQPFEAIKQMAFHDDLDRYKKWKMSMTRYETEFGITHAPAKDGTIDTKKIEEEWTVGKKIITRILKERKNKRAPFDPQAQQREFLQSLNADEEASEYQKRITSGNLSDQGNLSPRGQGDGTGRSRRGQSINDRSNNAIKKNQQDEAMERIRNIKARQHQHIEHQLQSIRRMVNTPEFVSSYYSTLQGAQFSKANPPKKPSPEVLIRMSQRIDRSQHQNVEATKQGGTSYNQEGHSTRSHREQINSSPLGNNNSGDGTKHDEDKESPIVALEPEEPGLKQGSTFMGGKKTAGKDARPSLYLQEKMYLKQKEQEHLLKAEEYHVVKTKEFNVAGRLRQDKPHVKVMQKSSAQSELNEKFITTECIADRRVKISSLAPRQYINAPSVEDVRKQGQHQMILSAINKKQTFAELINQANAMVTSVLHDPLKRSFNVMPSALKYGFLKVGTPYELVITLKNEDSVALRLNLKQCSDTRIKAEQSEMGLVAPGMIRKVLVTILSKEPGAIKDTLHIVTKSDIFKIPIEASVLSTEDYAREMQEQQTINPSKAITNSRVREKLNASIQKGRSSDMAQQKAAQSKRPRATSGEDGMEEMGEEMEGDMDNMADESSPVKGGWVETTNSESKLPKLPQGDKRPFDVDPKKNLKEVLKK